MSICIYLCNGFYLKLIKLCKEIALYENNVIITIVIITIVIITNVIIFKQPPPSHAWLRVQPDLPPEIN